MLGAGGYGSAPGNSLAAGGGELAKLVPPGTVTMFWHSGQRCRRPARCSLTAMRRSQTGQVKVMGMEEAPKGIARSGPRRWARSHPMAARARDQRNRRHLGALWPLAFGDGAEPEPHFCLIPAEGSDPATRHP